MSYEYTDAIEQVLFQLIDPNDDDALALINAKLALGWGLIDIFAVVEDYKSGALGGGGGITLVGAIDDNDTSLVASVGSWPPVPFDIVIDDERITVAARTGATLSSLTRGVGASDPAAHADEAAIVLVTESVITDHGALGGLSDDDHSAVYYNKTASDLRYASFTYVDDAIAGVTVGDITIDADDVAETATKKWFTSTERTKLTGVATNATANDTDANLKNRGNHTGTQDANTIVDALGTGSTDGRKYTKAMLDAVNRVPSSGTVATTSDISTHADLNDNTRAHYSTAINVVARTNDDYIFGTPGPDHVQQVIDYAGGTLADWVEQVADTLYVETVVTDVHMDQTSGAHGLPDTSRILAKDANGVYTLSTAGTPPAGNPSNNSIYFWVQSNAVHFKDKDGNQVDLPGTFKNEFMLFSADSTAYNNDATLHDAFTTTNNLAINATYEVHGVLFYLAGAGTEEGGMQVGWSTDATGSSFDWSLTGMGQGHTGTGATGSGYWRHRPIGSVGLLGGADTTRLAATINGLWTTSTTAGKPTLRFGQAIAVAATQPTIIKANSYVTWRRIA